MLILRNRLKYALTRRESTMIVMRRLVEIDGKVRTDINYPVGFQGEARRERNSVAAAGPCRRRSGSRSRAVPAAQTLSASPRPTSSTA